MSDHHLELDAYSIVLLGAFNPAIFQPLWFSANNLIRKEEAASAKITIIHPNATAFSAEWFSLQVFENRFAIETHDPTKASTLRDLAIGTFKVLEHTPLAAFGMNRMQHFKMASFEGWHNFGHYLAPKDCWNDILKNPGMRQLVIEGERTVDKGTTQINVAPSLAVKPGVFIAINEHHDLEGSHNVDSPGEETQQTKPTPAERNTAFMSIINNRWDQFIAETANVANHLFGCAKRSGTKPGWKTKKKK